MVAAEVPGDQGAEHTKPCLSNAPLESTLGAELNRLRLVALRCSTAAVVEAHSSGRISRVK